MTVWSAEIEEIKRLHESLKSRLPDLENELEKLIKTDDENIVLVYSRRCLEVIITDLCENELKRPRKTEPLKGIIDKLNHDEKVPSNIIASMDGLNSLSTFGAHPKDFDPYQVKPVLSNLAVIIKWYMKYKDSQIISKVKRSEDQITDKVKTGEEPTIIKGQTDQDQITGKVKTAEALTVTEIKTGKDQISEFISDEKKEQTKTSEILKEIIRKPGRSLIPLFIVVLAGVAIFVYPGIFKLDRLEKLKSSDERISVAVMPFQNITNDDTKNFWQEIIQDNLITSLSNSAELKVRQKESINTLLQSNDLTNYASITSSIASNISQKLNARVFVHGSISQIGTIIRINARLIDSKTEEVVISFQIDGTAENILNMTDSLSVMLKNYLVVTLMKKEVSKDFQRYLGSTKSPEALRYYIDGHNAFFEGDFRSAIEMFHHAIEIDSNFITPMIFLAVSYGNQSLYEDAKKWSLKAYEKRDNVPRIDKVFAEQIYATYCGSLIEAIKYLRQMLDIDDQQAAVYYELGVIYDMLGQHVKAIPEYEKSLEIFNRWDIKPMWINNYTALGHDYHKTGQDKKEKKLYKRAEQDFPDNQTLIYRQTILALSEGKTNNANDYIEKYCSLLEGKSYSEAAITSNLGFIYWDARLFDKAEEYLRRALSLEPEKSLRLNNLACLLIENNINIDEGIELVDKALKLSPDNYEYLDTKGWGIYKQGKYRHALEILQKSWDLRMENAIYDHEAFLHLQETKKAVASMTPQPDF